MVLFVDDDESVLEFLRLLANQIGIPFRTVLSAEEALDLCATSPDIDVVVTDISMPDMDGVQFAAALRHLGSSARIFSFSAGSCGREKSDLDAVFDASFSKPCDYPQLMVETLITMANNRYRPCHCQCS